MATEGLRLLVFARHAESVANTSHVLNGDPARPVVLTERGRAQARVLGAQLAHLRIDLAIGTRFLRTPHGESPNDAFRRHADALRRLLARTEPVTLIVLHEFALRSIALAAEADGTHLPAEAVGNAVPFLFDEPAIRRAATTLDVMAESSAPTSEGNVHRLQAAAHPIGQVAEANAMPVGQMLPAPARPATERS